MNGIKFVPNLNWHDKQLNNTGLYMGNMTLNIKHADAQHRLVQNRWFTPLPRRQRSVEPTPQSEIP